ncbi:MAG: aminotransferase class V-fold PLP-dependent enzyme [Luteitalea sp.]|nr:aminotransferase class V-fold PLP-dependent enzyme [Luteitalea sp.]
MGAHAILNLIYLDAHATTPCDPAVVEAMQPYFAEAFGNAASRHHAFGWRAREAVDAARAEIAALIGAHHKDILFTSGATESNNLALKGVAEGLGLRAEGGRHIVSVATEHRSVLDSCAALEARGVRVTRLPVQPDGLLVLDDLQAAIASDTVMVSVMAANNEIGVLQPLAEIGAVCRERGVLFHTDAAQAVGKIPIDVDRMQIDLLSCTAHKIYGPKGIGALYVRRQAKSALAAQMHGGGHERGLRSGTLNVPGIVGFGKACAISRSKMGEESEHLRLLRDRLLAGLEAAIADLQVNGSMEKRLPHNLHVSIPGIEGSALFLALDDIAVSPGAACTTASAEPSHVLAALSVNEDLGRASIRFGLTRFTTAEEIEYVISRLAGLVPHLRARQAALR